MASKNFKKINDLSDSPLRQRFSNDGVYAPDSNHAVTFGRVSILKNKNSGNSDLAQKEHMGDYISAQGLDVVKEWDIAETAFVHEDRKEFAALDKFLRANRTVKHVVFSHVSRASRNKKSANMIEEWILEMGVVVHFAREGMRLHQKSDDAAWIIWHVKVTQHETESKNTRRNVWDGMIKAFERGVYPSRGPFGYKNIRTEANEAAFRLDDEKAAYMRAAYERFASGSYSVPALKRELDLEFSHLKPTPNKKQLDDLLKNPFYYGDFVWDETLYHGNPDYHPPLVSYDLWQKVQAVFKRPGRSKRKVTKRNHPYLGLIKCSGKILDQNGNETEQVCGSSITCEEKRRNYKNGTSQTFHYLHCSNSSFPCSQKNKAFMAAQGRKLSYTERDVEVMMQKILTPLHFDAEICAWMQQVLLEEHKTKSQDHKQQMSALQRRQQMLHRYIDEAYEDKLKGEIDEGMWREKNDNWRSQLTDVENQLRVLDNSKEQYIQNGVLLIELAQRAESIYENATPEKKRRMVEIVSSNLRLRDGSLEFDYRKPFDLLAVGPDFEKWRTREDSNL